MVLKHQRTQTTKLLQTSPISFDEDYDLTEDILLEHENRFKRIDNPAWLTIFTPDHKAQETYSTQSSSTTSLSSSDDADDDPVETTPVITATTISKPTWLPSLDAWKSVIQHENIITDSIETPPPTLNEYLYGIREISDAHKLKIHELWMQVKNHGKMKYLDHAEAKKVVEALRIAYLALWGKKTNRSLEVAVNRARGTAAVLGELKATMEVILAGILHEVVKELQSSDENEGILGMLESLFGSDVMKLSEKYSRLPKFLARNVVYTPMQSENHLQMLVALAEDYRVLYVRIADRLHTLRVLRTLPLDHKDRIKIAQEALHVYAPLAHKMGIMKVKGELEDLAFRVLNPEMFQETKYTQIAANKAYHEASEKIQSIMNSDEFLSKQNATFHLTYRIKDKYQLSLKMERKNLSSPKEVRDALGLRIIINAGRKDGETDEEHDKRGVDMCYHLVNRLREMEGWEPSENGYKDYIKDMKENGYQSIHQYIRHISLNTNVEVQVRTIGMHVKAELGEAAHWHYKDQIYRPEVASSKVYKQTWKMPIQLLARSPAEFIGMAKQYLVSNRVFVFLDDKSTVLSLKKGTSVLDAAFAIHTDLGLSAQRVLVDGKPVGLNRPLKNGDVVSVERAPTGVITAKPSWLSILKTSYAQGVLRRYLRDNHNLMLASFGLVQLLITITASLDKIKKRFGGSLPNAKDLAKFSQIRTGKNIEELLVELGTCSKPVCAQYMSKLLDIPLAEVTAVSMAWGLAWARLQSQENETYDKILLPMLRDVLPNAGLKNIEYKWCELIGVSHVDDVIVPSEKSRFSKSRSMRSMKPTPTIVIPMIPKELPTLEVAKVMPEVRTTVNSIMSKN